MVPETHMKLCMAEPDFLEKIFCPKNWENGTEFLHAGADSGKLKVISMILGRVWSKIVMTI